MRAEGDFVLLAGASIQVSRLLALNLEEKKRAMSIGGILFLVVAILSLFFFIYLIVLTARGWGVAQTMLLCILFIECWCFLFFTAGVMRKRVGPLKEFAASDAEAVKLEDELKKLLWGSGAAEEVDSVTMAKSELHKATVDRGRDWRNVKLLDQQANEYRLQLVEPRKSEPAVEPPPTDATAPAPAAAATGGAAPAAATPATTPPAGPVPAAQPAATTPAAPAGAAPPPRQGLVLESFPQNMVVYAFAEEADSSGRQIPVFYLGAFKVKEYQNLQLVVEPVSALEASQTAYIKDGKAATWTLYELLPLDGHEAYAAPGSKPTGEMQFGRMDKETIEKLFANIPDPDGRRAKIIEQYLRDGQRANSDDPDSHKWTEVSLKKPYSVDVDSPDVANATIGGYFDVTGRSIDLRIKRGAEAKLAEKSNLLLNAAAAKDLIDRQIADLVQLVYVRPLISYEQSLGQLGIRRTDLTSTIALFERDSAILTESNNIDMRMINSMQIEKQLIETDLAQHEIELAAVKNAVRTAVNQLAQTKSRMSRLYQQIHAQHTLLLQAQPAYISTAGR